MEKLQFLCCCGMIMVKLPSGVWDTTLQATKRETDRWLTISILHVKLQAWLLHEPYVIPLPVKMLWTFRTLVTLVFKFISAADKYIISSGILYFCALTEWIDEFAECYCEAAPWLVESEEQHGDILRRPYDWSSHSSLAVIRVTLVQRKRMVLCAGKLLALHHPAVKYLKDIKVAFNTILL